MAYYCKNLTTRLTMENTNHCTVFNESTLSDLYSGSGFPCRSAFALFQLVLSCYLLIVIGVYKFRHGCRRHNTSPVNHLSLAAVALHTIYVVRVVVEIFDTVAAASRCEVFNIVGAVCYNAGTGLLYGILWARQRKFYSDPLLNHSTNTLLKVCSSTLIFGIYAILIIVAVFFLQSYCMMSTRIGCLIVWDHSNAASVVLYCTIAFISICFVGQILLFFLITYPLSAASKPNGVQWRSQVVIHKLVWRLAVCTSVCVFTSLLMALAILLDATDILCGYWINWVGFDLLLNNIAVIVSFADWKERLFPLFRRKRSVPEQNTVSISNLISIDPSRYLRENHEQQRI